MCIRSTPVNKAATDKALKYYELLAVNSIFTTSDSITFDLRQQSLRYRRTNQTHKLPVGSHLYLNAHHPPKDTGKLFL
ncbi:hypothetical protein V6N13_026308 [Hibiscus sabdariffa]|uniref:Uncharacterized protein n=1 Tax=Hibiscus sabdariffa TaxID=183260 RepID=A0ABR2AQK1_9ROSI